MVLKELSGNINYRTHTMKLDKLYIEKHWIPKIDTPYETPVKEQHKCRM